MYKQVSYLGWGMYVYDKQKVYKMQDFHQRKYDQAAIIDFVLWKPDGSELMIDATFADGDVTVMTDEGTESATSASGGNPQFHTFITDKGKGYSIAIPREDMGGALIVIYIIDQGTKAWLDHVIIIDTYGNSLAQHEFDLDDAITVSGGCVHADMRKISGVVPAQATSHFGVNVVKISEDETAADNLEKAYDGTGYGIVLQQTTIATLASQTSFTLTAGSSNNNAYQHCMLIVEDSAAAAQKAVGYIDAYTGDTKTVTLVKDPAIFTMAEGDKVTIIATSLFLQHFLKTKYDNSGFHLINL